MARSSRSVSPTRTIPNPHNPGVKAQAIPQPWRENAFGTLFNSVGLTRSN